jgi:hypothetical protein
VSRTGLKLRAIDAEDLAMISAILQDALVAPSDLAFQRGRFGGVLVRFCREERTRPADAPIRQVKCALSLGTVTAVRLRGVDRHATAPLEVLALSAGEDDERPRHVTMHFAGGGALRIEVERLDLRLEDIGDPWGTSLVPHHGS